VGEAVTVVEVGVVTVCEVDEVAEVVNVWLVVLVVVPVVVDEVPSDITETVLLREFATKTSPFAGS